MGSTMTAEEKADILLAFIDGLYVYYKIDAKLETSKEETVRMFDKLLVDIKYDMQLTDLIKIFSYVSDNHIQITLKYKLEERYRPLPPISLKDLSVKTFLILLDTYALKESKKLSESYKRDIAGLEVMLDLVQGK
jgi:hypothetical protein